MVVTPSPAPSPGPQEVRDAWIECDYEDVWRVCIETSAQVCEFKVGPKHFADDLAKAINAHAALRRYAGDGVTEQRRRDYRKALEEIRGERERRSEMTPLALAGLWIIQIVATGGMSAFCLATGSRFLGIVNAGLCAIGVAGLAMVAIRLAR